MVDDIRDLDPENDHVVLGALKEIGCERADDLLWMNLKASHDPPAFDERGQEVAYKVTDEDSTPELRSSLVHWIPYPPGWIMYFGVVPDECDIGETNAEWVTPGPPIALYLLVPAADSDISKEELIQWLRSGIPQMRESAVAAAGEVPA